METTSGWKRAVHKAVSYSYVALWDRKYATKRFLATRVVPIAMVILSVIEILGAGFHIVPHLQVQSENVELTISVALAVVALTLVWHHRRQEKRIKKSEAILVAIRAACVDKPRGPVDSEGTHATAVFEFMHDLLTKTVVALEADPIERKLHATILLQDGRNSPFRIFDQFPSGTFPSDEVALDPSISSAAICASTDLNTVLYIPMPRFLHGIKMTFVNAPHADATSTEIVENAFQAIGAGPEKNQHLLKSFASIQIPKETYCSGRLLQQLGIGQDARLILCLGSSSADSLGPLEFNVLLAVANLLGMAFE